jgi:drug/metabolite transporter (DMT)-like permease
MQDNLGGAMTRLGSAVEGFQLALAGPNSKALQGFVDGLANIVGSAAKLLRTFPRLGGAITVVGAAFVGLIAIAPFLASFIAVVKSLGGAVAAMKIGATIAGFVGVVIATGPSLVSLETGVIVGLTRAAAAALIVFLNRSLARTEPTATIMLYIGLVTTLGTAPVAAFSWQPLPISDLLLVSLTGAFGAFGMWLTIEAYRVGEVSALAPVPYLRIVIAILFGMLIFGEIPTWSTLIGAAIIIAATLAATRHERHRRGVSVR